MNKFDMSFYKGKRVLITGHTGFKGSWMSQMLLMQGCDVYGYALKNEDSKSLYNLSGTSKDIHSFYADIRDLNALKNAFDIAKPEIVIHMAAQPLVRKSYEEPVYTFETNVMGTVNVLECIRKCDSVTSFVNVTTDKVYKNFETNRAYKEDDILCGFDPYSNSKSCSELVTDSYTNSFFGKDSDRKCAISRMRAGNVIGGGDFAKNRIIPDCVRAALSGEDIIIRNPDSIRPYQFVLEPIYAYLFTAAMQYRDKKYAGTYNVGPLESDHKTTKELVELFCNKWNKDDLHNKINYICKNDNGPKEAELLKLSTKKIQDTFGLFPHMDIEKTMDFIIEFADVYSKKGNIAACMKKQITEFLKLC